jgi:hypothetical protein
LANEIKDAFLKELTKRYGSICKLSGSYSLYDIGDGAARVYVRYSKVHGRKQTFYGLRREDLQQLEGHASTICFLWDDQPEPLFVPFSDYEDIFQSVNPAGDGQYKAQIYLSDGTEFYIAGAGRFSAESYFGWGQLEALLDSAKLTTFPSLSHSQVQTLLGAIGTTKGYDVWVPQNDRAKLEWTLTPRFSCCDRLPDAYTAVMHILQEVDVIWIEKGSSRLRSLFEVEHSTPIYSGLLRFNDIRLVAPNIHSTFSIVANDARRTYFVRQIRRPTFQRSGLSEFCTFLEYPNVLGWYNRLYSLRPNVNDR